MPKTFIKGIEAKIEKTLKELNLKPSKGLDWFFKNEKRFYALPCLDNQGLVVFFKMLITAEKSDMANFKREIAIVNFLSRQKTTGQKLSSPHVFRINNQKMPYWLLREYIKGPIIGHHFKIFKSGLTANIQKKIIEILINLRDLKKIGLKLKTKTKEDYWKIIKSFEKDIKSTANYQGQIDFKQIENFFHQQAQCFEQAKMVFCHGDFTLANFFLAEKKLYLTDWEHLRLDNQAADISRLWIQTWRYPKWRNKLITDFLQKMPKKERSSVEQLFRITTLIEALGEFTGDVLTTKNQTKRKTAMLKTIVDSLKGFNQLIKL